MTLLSVSVAMATYNGGRFIAEQLESLRLQTVLPAELVITDDCSTDDTIKIIEDFSRSAPFPVRFERNSERLGYQANFMRAAQLCVSDVVSFCDQDDVWDKSKIELCLNGFYDSSIFLVYHNAQVVSEELKQLGNLNHLGRKESTINQLGMGPLLFPLGFTILFRRNLLTLSAYWNQSISYDFDRTPESHDQWIPFLANTFGSVVYLDQRLAKYRRHGNNASVGAKWRFGAGTRLKRIAAFGGAGWSNFEVTFRRRAEILEKIAESPLEGFSTASALRGAAHYRAYEQLYRQRISLYRSNSFVERMGLFSKILRGGGYRGDPWSKGLGSACKDMIRGVFHV
jgi:glycosyltransferase involved in cell wall biosynthesis